ERRAHAHEGVGLVEAASGRELDVESQAAARGDLEDELGSVELDRLAARGEEAGEEGVDVVAVAREERAGELVARRIEDEEALLVVREGVRRRDGEQARARRAGARREPAVEGDELHARGLDGQRRRARARREA